MPAPLMHKKEVLERLLGTLCDKGYDGASLDDLSATSGLGASRLHDAFPGGKEDIARQVMQHLNDQLAKAVFEPLRSKKAPARKLAELIAAIDAHYDGGRRASLFGRLSASADRLAFRPALVHAFDAWVDAIEGLCVEAGLPRTVARARAEDMLVRLEGALVICAGTGDAAIFARTLKALGTSLLAPREARED
jgi:TetR/AcrR family transcriptional repressor of lmrAB and yxaGH operons